MRILCIIIKKYCSVIFIKKKSKILENKFIIPILIVGISLLISFVIFRNFTICCILLTISALINFYQNKFDLGIDLSPSLVLLIIFSMKLGFGYGLIFLIFGSVIPSVITGGINESIFFFVGLAIFIAYLGSLVLIDNLMIYGIALIVVQSLAGFLFSIFITGNPRTSFSVVIGLALNIFYFMIFSRILFAILV